MSNLPATTSNWVDLVAPAADLARTIAGTDFVPQEMRNKPAVVTACILFGAELGLGPMQSLSKVDVVKGRPAPRAELARALALAAGHELWVEESTNTRVKISGRRKNSEHTQTVIWTMDDVKKAGISNGAYAKYPRQMLLARASAELVRMMCPEVLGGIGLVAEEAADLEPDTTSIISGGGDEPAKTNTRRRREPAPTAALPAPPLPDEDPETGQFQPGPTQPDGPSDAQMKRMHAAFNEAGFHDRDERLKITRSIIGREISSSRDLNKHDAAQVIDFLVKLEAGDAAVIVDDEGNLTAVDQTSIVPLPGEEQP